MRDGDTRQVGPYELKSRLGQGGMGSVYLATDRQGREVAVKLLRPELMYDDEFRRRFRSEVDRARQVPPFCTAEVLDADPFHHPPYLVVEYIDGPTLSEVVRRSGPLGRTNLHSLAVGIATALSAIHGAGVIHRDLKPGNVLFGVGGIKVIDFGIARALEATSQHTRTNQMVGTIAYMAPERFDHESSARVGTAADIFAWGAVVAYAGTGRTPFGAASSPATAMRILTQPPELFDLPEPVRGLVEQALAKDPGDRPTSREILDRLLTPSPAAAPSAAPPRRARARNAAPFLREAAPFLREAVEVARHRPPRQPVVIERTPVNVPVRKWIGALRNAQVAAAAAMTLIVVLVVVALGNRAGPPDALADDLDGTEATATVGLGVQGPAALLTGERRIALQLTGTNRQLGLEDNGRASLAGTAEPLDLVAVPQGSSYRLRVADTDDCLTVRTSDNSLRRGTCADTFDLTLTAGALVITSRYGPVRWSSDRSELFVQAAREGIEPTTFTLLDRGPA